MRVRPGRTKSANLVRRPPDPSPIRWARGTGEADAVFEGGALRQGVGVVAEGGEEVEEKGLGFALFVALELGSKLGEIPQSFFL